MPLNSFAFQKPALNDLSEPNWKILDTATKTYVKSDLTITSATSDPVVNMGYFTMYGPLVFYTIKMTLDSNDGWTTSSYITMPFSELVTNVPLFAAQHHGEAYVSITGAVITQLVFITVGSANRLGFGGAYTNGTGADQIVFLQGWYFRN